MNDPIPPRRPPTQKPVDLNLSMISEQIDMPLLAASGAASTARRICDMLAMRGYEPEDTIRAAKLARAMFASGAVQLTQVITALENE